MQKYSITCFILIVLLILSAGCKSTIEKRIHKDITGINEQLYELEKKQIKDANRLKYLEGQLGQISQEKKVEDAGEQQDEDADMIYKEGYKSYLEQKYDEAIKQLAKLTDRFKDDSIIDNALYWQAEAYLKMNKPDQALNYYQKLYRYYPFSSKADYALYKTGLIYQDMKDYNMAGLAYKRLVNEYPGSDLYKTALLKIKQIKPRNRRKQ